MKYTQPFAAALCLLLAACNGGEKQTAAPTPSEQPPAASRPSENKQAAASEQASAAQTSAEVEVPAHLKAGKDIYDKRCKACHGIDGKGSNAALPPLAQADYFADDKMQLVASVTRGIRGKITVNGKEYDGIMPSFPMKDEEVAAVATYVLNSFGNGGGEISTEEVAAYRKAK